MKRCFIFRDSRSPPHSRLHGTRIKLYTERHGVRDDNAVVEDAGAAHEVAEAGGL